jgi:hypothetical protein
MNERMMETRYDDIRAKYADIVVTVDNTLRIPCCRYLLASTCDVIRHVLEDNATVDTIPFDGVDAKALECALDLLHRNISLDDADLLTMSLIRQGMHVLGCALYDSDIRMRAWKLVKESGKNVVLRPWMYDFMKEPSIRLDVLKRFVVMYGPRWQDLSDELGKSSLAPSVDIDTATYLVSTLTRFFPPSLVVPCILKFVANVTLDNALAIVGQPAAGTYYHPSDVADVCRFLRRRFPQMEFLRTMSDGLSTFDYAPLASIHVGGSVVTFTDGSPPMASAVLILDGKAPARTIAVASWVTVRLAPRIDVIIKANKLDHRSQAARGMQLRIMAYQRSNGVGQEAWATWHAPSWNPRMPASVYDQIHLRPQLEMLRAVVSGSSRHQVVFRIDVFYGEQTVLLDPPLSPQYS